MKKAPTLLVISALILAITSVHAAPVLAPNGDFSAGITDWGVASSGPATITFPTSGGNPDDHGAIDFGTGAPGNFAVIFSNPPVAIATLGLSPGNKYTFSLDMRNLSGPGVVGKIKLEFLNSGGAEISNTGDIDFTVMGDGSTWETYEFDRTIPADTVSIKFVPVWGGDDTFIGFDNIGVDNAPLTPISEIPNGDFEISAGAMWDTTSEGGTFAFSFPASGGNPDGHGIIDHTANDGGSGSLVSNNGESIPLSGLGLVAGSTYTFSQDMKILGGMTNSIGGLKVDFFSGAAANGSTGEQYPALIGTGATWETYDFDVTIPPGTDGIKVVPISGAGSSVGYDNITFNPVPVPTVPITEIPNGDFETSAGAMWNFDFDFGTFIPEFPASGGNPGGYAVIDHTANDGGFGVLVANNGGVIPLSGLGLVAGSTYKFSQDMINLNGPGAVGGLKVEFLSGAADNGDTGDMNPASIGTGETWETYDFSVAIPAGTDGIKVIPLWSVGQRVGYDNITFDPTPLVAPPITEIPNGDFETADGADWSTAGEANTMFTYPAAEGNPTGHAVMSNDGSGFGVLVSNEGGIIPISGLGLVAGNTYKFSQDMKIISGLIMGGMKVEFYTGAVGNGDTGEMFPFSISDPASWQTYDFYVTIPAGTDGIKVVPLWGSGSDVGYDNVTFDPTPTSAPPITEIPNGNFEAGSAAWAEGGAPDTTFDYPTSGGNPNRYGTMTNNGVPATFGIWISNSNSPIPISGLGLETGKAYKFSQDMRNESGPGAVGGFKVEFFNGDTGVGAPFEEFPALIGDGSTWETYDFEVTIPGGVDGIKVLPLWGAGTTVGYDNVTFDPSPITPPIPNGDFENGSTSWFIDGTDTAFAFPSTGGNPDGYAAMNNTGPGLGILVANNGAPILLNSVGLAGGDSVQFSVDMTLFSGSNIGGLRVEYFQGPTLLGSTGDIFPPLIGTGASWDTYVYDTIELPATADAFKLSLLSGDGSEVGFDNVVFSTPDDASFAADIELGTVVSWSTTSTTNLFQPQESSNGMDWSNLGSILTGNAVTSAFDPDGSPFYRVLEIVVLSGEAALNGGFEIPDGDCAESWSCIGSQPPTRTTSDFRSGGASMQILVQNDETPTPNNGEIQQNIANAGGTITPGDSYDFSFYAKKLSSGESYVQQVRVQWLSSGGGIVSEAFGFTPFAGGTGTWEEFSRTGLVAPAGATTAFIQIFGTTGAVPDIGAEGGVLIDDVTLVGSATTPPAIEAALNGDFEIFDGLSCAESWVCAGDDPPFNDTFLSQSGIASMQMLVDNGGVASTRTSELSQDIAMVGGSITAGAIYDFSFFAQQISSGPNFMQQYRVQWLDGGGSVISDAIPLTTFPGGASVWTETAVTGLVAPVGAASALIEFVASTDAVSGASGEVYIDDVSLAEMTPPMVLPASAADGLEVSWGTKSGSSYQVQCSTSLYGFTNAGAPISGDGNPAAVTDLRTLPLKYYRVVETTP